MATYSIPPIGPGWQLAALVARYRFSATIEREVLGILEEAYKDIARRLRRSGALSRTDRSALEDRFLEIRTLLTEAYGTARATVTPMLRDYAAIEREVVARQLQAMAAVQRVALTAALPTSTTELARTIGAAVDGASLVIAGVPRQLVVSSARLTEIVDTLDIGGIGFGDWWTKARDDGVLRVRRLIQTGLVQGLNPTDIGARIWSSRLTNGPNAWRQSRSVAMTAARTVVTAIQTDAQLAAEAQFASVIGRYRFEAIIDSRTSEICRPLDGTEWDRDDPRTPTPPLHPNCRSSLVPIVDLPGLPVDARAPRLSYDAWLRQQPSNVQNLVLGKGIAEHYRAGKTELRDLLSIDRRPIGLAQLRRVLASTQPESYVAWIASLPASAQRAVLGPALAKRLADGTATIAELLRVSASHGIVTTTP